MIEEVIDAIYAPTVNMAIVALVCVDHSVHAGALFVVTAVFMSTAEAMISAVKTEDSSQFRALV